MVERDKCSKQIKTRKKYTYLFDIQQIFSLQQQQSILYGTLF